MSRHRRSKKNTSGFTLVEVMVTMFLVSMMCLGVFAGLQQITIAMMNVAIRDEGYHLMQAEVERLLASDYSSLAAVSDQSITSAVKTSYVPSSTAQFGLTSDNATGRVTFTRRVVAVSSTSTSTTLRVEVQWTWNGRTSLISTPVLRSQ